MLGRVLIIDDDEEVLLQLEDALENAGYDTTVTLTLSRGEALLQRRQYDLVLLDDFIDGQQWDALMPRVLDVARATPVIVLAAERSSPHKRHASSSAQMVFKRAPAEVLRVVQRCVGGDAAAGAGAA